jgi:ribosomal protein L16 Arg81 hydroxylase
MMWIGPAGTLTSLHHDLTNNFIAQIVGRKRIKLVPAAEVGKMYNDQHVFSAISDLEDPGLDLSRYPRLAGLRVYDVLLEPGEILFVPFGWWHQVRSLDFSVTITFTNFRYPNDVHVTYPAG